jgi:hypothetical protein
MSDSQSSWVNNIAKIWRKKDNSGNFMSLPLAEPVTLKLQRKTKDGFVVEEVTLIPQTNDKGYSSVMFTMKKPEPYQGREGVVNPPENLKFELSLPPQSSGDGESDF